MKEDKLLENLFEAHAYWGHHKKNRNPKIKKFICSTINKIDIINLDHTVKQIENCKFIIKSYPLEDILVISSRRDLHIDGIKIVPKWKPGMLTNFYFGKLDRLPKLLIVDKAHDNAIALKEASKCEIKTIGVCDTNSSLVNINHFIVINDDNEKAAQFVINHILGK